MQSPVSLKVEPSSKTSTGPSASIRPQKRSAYVNPDRELDFLFIFYHFESLIKICTLFGP